MKRLRTVRSKIVLLLLIGLAGTLMNAGVSYYGKRMKNIQFELARGSQLIKNQVLENLMLEQQIINRRDPQVLDSLRKAEGHLQSFINGLKGRSDDRELLGLVEKLERAQDRHQKVFGKIAENLDRLDTARNQMAEASARIAAGLSKIVDSITMESTNLMMTGEELSNEKDAFQELMKDLLVSINLKALNLQNLFVLGDAEHYKTQLQVLEKRLAQDRKNTDSAAKNKAVSDFKGTWTEIAKLLDENDKLESALFTEWELNRKLRLELKQAVDVVGRQASDITERSAEMINYYDRLGDTLSFGVVGLAALVFLVVGGLFIRTIQRSLKRAITNVDSGARQVAATADQLQVAGTELANGASEQASSLEETSASLEEMSTMTKHNADNAREAKNMMETVVRIVEKVDSHMENMAKAINEITRSSEETGNIIKTIDEIAFQTNLLALNAAVEAARAGEAGAGFAVVADEVRNLAMRAADAARSTSGLIESTIQAVRGGSELAQSTQEVFKENVDISEKVRALVNDIASASKEQANGIGQLNQAITEIDKVTQRNAASAEESAGASEEMSAQALQMKRVVRDLATLVDGIEKTGEQES